MSEEPRLFAILPELLRHYVSVIRFISTFTKRSTAPRPLLRERAFVLLHFLTSNGSKEESAFKELAIVMAAGVFAAGRNGEVILDRSLKTNFLRFERKHPDDFKALHRSATLANDDPEMWRLLAPFVLFSKKLLKPLP